MSPLATSRVVRAADFREPWLLTRAAEFNLTITRPVRKIWEWCAIAQVYLDYAAPKTALGFGVGRDRVPAWMARFGYPCVATDQKPTAEASPWMDSGQHAPGLLATMHPDIADPSQHVKHVEFQHADMRALPADLRNGSYGFTWSAGSLEHLGGRKAGLDFFCAQMECLRTRGIAAHATELDVSDWPGEVDARDLALYHREDLEKLGERLAKQGDRLWPLDLAPGTEDADLYVDEPPYDGRAHLRMMAGGRLTTSVLLVATKGAA